MLSQLSLSENATKDYIKAAIEEKLNSVLPAGSYTLILRSYQGDFRARNSNQSNYMAMFLIDQTGRKAALEHKDELESMGFRVSPTGEISLN